MPFVKILDKEPPTDKEILLRNLSPFMTGQDVYIREMFSQHWSENKELSLQTEWLDESITEDMVKDLVFDGLPNDGENKMWCAKAYGGEARYEITPVIGVYQLRAMPHNPNKGKIYTLYTDEQFNTLDEAIAEANCQNKKYILSQLK